MINVTKTRLPDRKKLDAYIDRIYESGWATNRGELVQELERLAGSDAAAGRALVPATDAAMLPAEPDQLEERDRQDQRHDEHDRVRDQRPDG